MHDVTVIDDPAAAEASLDPIRARLLAELAEPGSASTLALSFSTSWSASRLNQFLRRTRRRISFFARLAAMVNSQVESFAPCR